MIKFIFYILIVLLALTISLSGCAGSNSNNSTPTYVGQWSGSGAKGSPQTLNLRADNTFSYSIWNAGSFTIGDRSSLTYAEKGTYTFTPTTQGDDTAGTLHRQITHTYNLSSNQWEAVSSSDDLQFTIHTDVSPHVMDGAAYASQFSQTYTGPAVTIPNTY